jgi:hypothetical protein
VYDTALGKIVLFGGLGVFDPVKGSSYLGDTWMFDGTDWTQIQAEDMTGITAPLRRSLVAAEYDPIGQVIVLYGGRDNLIAYGDTWTFNGSSWTLKSVGDPAGQSAPLARSGAGMTYDPAIGGLILFGGNLEQNNTYANDTWNWDGNAWTQLHPPSSPSGREQFGFAYDSIHQQMVLFGGGSSPSRLAFKSDTWTFGLPPVQLKAVVSRKFHGSAGTFDVDLPLAGSRGIECRSGGINSSHTLVFTFANTLTSVSGASVTSGTGSVASSNIDSSDAHNYIVNLTGVVNAQVITVSLTNVTDSAGNFSSAVSVQMGVLLGDVNASGRIDAADVSLVRQQTLQPITSSNFREDVNASGRIDAADVSIVRQQTLTSLP